MKNNYLKLLFDIGADINEIFQLKILKVQPQKPWMRHRELNIIKEVLTTLKPSSCLEWGAGFSTLYFPGFLNENVTWITVEHDKRWFEKISVLNNRRNVRISHVPISSENGKNYVAFPKQFGLFDFIFIDGRLRPDCLKEAFALVSDRGVVVLHDANREEYANALKFFPQGYLFQDQRRYHPTEKIGGGVFVGSRGRKIDDVLDVEVHQRVWEFYNKAGRIFKFL